MLISSRSTVLEGSKGGTIKVYSFDGIGIGGTITAVPYAAVKTDLILRMEEISGSLVDPGVGEVLVIPDAGIAVYNTTDYTKTATLTSILVKYL